MNIIKSDTNATGTVLFGKSGKYIHMKAHTGADAVVEINGQHQFTLYQNDPYIDFRATSMDGFTVISGGVSYIVVG